MRRNLLTLSEQIQDTSANRRHLVILGAGASKANCPSGDRYGKQVPLMDELVYVEGLNDLLLHYGVEDVDEPFESLFSRLSENSSYTALCDEIRRRLYTYFSELVIPEYPTIYDYLILALREKDVVATFNWDPFLWQAWRRNYYISRGPQLLFLHGCTNVGFCGEHLTEGILDEPCPVCLKKRKPVPLLYPTNKKNYIDEQYIKIQWDSVQVYLKSARLLTIFGYSAPTTDVEAIKLMKSAWGEPHDRWLDDIELIDRPGCSDEEISRRWSDFIHHDHYQVKDNFFNSMLAESPRRTVETQWKRVIECQVYYPNAAPRNCTLQQLQDWHSSLIRAED